MQHFTVYNTPHNALSGVAPAFSTGNAVSDVQWFWATRWFACKGTIQLSASVLSRGFCSALETLGFQGGKWGTSGKRSLSGCFIYDTRAETSDKRQKCMQSSLFLFTSPSPSFPLHSSHIHPSDLTFSSVCKIIKATIIADYTQRRGVCAFLCMHTFIWSSFLLDLYNSAYWLLISPKGQHPWNGGTLFRVLFFFISFFSCTYRGCFYFFSYTHIFMKIAPEM